MKGIRTTTTLQWSLNYHLLGRDAVWIGREVPIWADLVACLSKEYTEDEINKSKSNEIPT
jgi:hypothetical protein